jgi:hypothetical protein
MRKYKLHIYLGYLTLEAVFYLTCPSAGHLLDNGINIIIAGVFPTSELVDFEMVRW